MRVRVRHRGLAVSRLSELALAQEQRFGPRRRQGQSCQRGEMDAVAKSGAHLEILGTVSPSFRFHRLCKLEDIQPSTFLSARTTSGLNNWIFFPPNHPLFSQCLGNKTAIVKRLPRASRGSSFRFRLIRRIV